MSRPLVLVLWPFILLFVNKSQASQLGFYFDAKLNSPAAYLEDAMGDWQSTSSGDYAYGVARTGAWFKLSSNWTVGIERRVNHYFDFSPETAFFYGQLESQSIPVGVYELDLAVNSNSTKAMYLQYEYDSIDRLTINFRAYGLVGGRVQIGQLTGFGEVGADGSYTFQTDIDYLYDDNRLFDRPAPGIRGYGHSFDLSLAFKVTEKSTVGLKAEDLLYRLYWTPINQDKGCYARPLASCVSRGTTKQVNGQQVLPATISAFTRYQYKQVEWGVEAVNLARHDELWFTTQTKMARLGYEALNQQFNIGYQSEQLKVEWSFDDYRYHRANHWQISLGTQWAFQ